MRVICGTSFNDAARHASETIPLGDRWQWCPTCEELYGEGAK